MVTRLKQSFIKKICVTIGLIVLLILGNYLIVPTGQLPLSIFLPMEGLPRRDFFALGMTPMMYAMIIPMLWSKRKGKKTTAKKLGYQHNVFLTIIACIQAIAVVVSVPSPFWFDNVVAVLFLVTGAVVLFWLASINALYGIGGVSLIILTSLIVPQLKALAKLSDVAWYIIAIFVIWGIFVTVTMIFLDNAYYRIPFQQISVHNKYADESYLNLKLNLVGGMPIMYAYMVLSLPQHIVKLLEITFPQVTLFKNLALYFTTNTVYGTIVFFVTVVILTVILAFFAVDTYTIADNFRQAGDYIPCVRPGLPTQKYLNRRVYILASINALYLIVLLGIPMLLAVWIQELSPLAQMLGILMMIIGMTLTVLEDMKILKLRKQYTGLFE